MSTALAVVSSLDVARQVFGEMSMRDANELLWGFSSYPFGPTVEKYRQDLLTVKLTWESGQSPCDTCGAPAARFVCDHCRYMMEER